MPVFAKKPREVGPARARKRGVNEMPPKVYKKILLLDSGTVEEEKEFSCERKVQRKD